MRTVRRSRQITCVWRQNCLSITEDLRSFNIELILKWRFLLPTSVSILNVQHRFIVLARIATTLLHHAAFISARLLLFFFSWNTTHPSVLSRLPLSTTPSKFNFKKLPPTIRHLFDDIDIHCLHRFTWRSDFQMNSNEPLFPRYHHYGLGSSLCSWNGFQFLVWHWTCSQHLIFCSGFFMALWVHLAWNEMFHPSPALIQDNHMLWITCSESHALNHMPNHMNHCSEACSESMPEHV